jgi:hypothetical protein
VISLFMSGKFTIMRASGDRRRYTSRRNLR